MAQKMTPTEFMDQMRAKFPDLANTDIDDREMAKKILERRPEYADRVQTQVPITEFAARAREVHGQEMPDLLEMDDHDVITRMIQKNPMNIRDIDNREYLREEIRRAKQRSFQDAPVMQRFAAGVGKGIMDIYQGGRQLVGLEDPDWQAESREFETAASGDIASTLGEVTGSIAATAVPGTGAAGVAKGLSKIPKVARAVTKVSKAAPKTAGATTAIGTGAATGALEFTDEEESRAKNMMFGGLFGAGSQLIGKLGKKAFNALRGKMKDANSQELVDLAKKHNVSLSFGDVKQNPVAQKLENLLEDVPIVGTSGFRRKGEKKAAEAIKKFGEKTNGKIQDVGEDIKFSLTAKGQKLKRTSDKLYDRVEKLSGSAATTPSKTITQTDKVIKDLTESDVPSEGAETFFKKLKTNLETGDKTFTSLRKTRSSLGKEAEKYKINDPNRARLLRSLQSSIEKDMDDLIAKSEQGNQLQSAYKRANKFYREKVIPAREVSKKAARQTETDQLYSQFIKAGKGDKAKNFYDALDESGRAAVRTGMVREAIEKATSEFKDKVSPAKFAGYLERMKDARKVFFTGEAGKEIDGFTKLMRHAERFGAKETGVPTGVRVVQAAGLGGAGALGFFNPAVLAKVAVGASIPKLLLTSKAGRNFLLASSKLEPGSPKMQKLVERINRYLGPRAAAAGGVGAEE